MQDLTLAIEGMTCEHCQAAVQKALTQVDGVQEVEVSLEQGRARVRYDGDAAKLDEMMRAVDEEGYSAKPV